MAIRLNGTAYLELAWPPVTIEPVSLFALYNPTATNVSESVLSIYSSTSGNGFGLSQLGGVSNGRHSARKTSNGTDARADSTLTTESNLWQFGVAVFANSASRSIAHGVSNQNTASNTTSSTFTAAPNRLNIGCDQDGAGGRTKFFTGQIAECLVVRGIISQQQGFALMGHARYAGAAAVSPYDLFPRSAILFYAPLRDNLVDEISGLPLYNGGNPVVFSPHPIAMYKAPVQRRPFASAAAGVGGRLLLSEERLSLVL